MLVVHPNESKTIQFGNNKIIIVKCIVFIKKVSKSSENDNMKFRRIQYWKWIEYHSTWYEICPIIMMENSCQGALCLYFESKCQWEQKETNIQFIRSILNFLNWFNFKILFHNLTTPNESILLLKKNSPKFVFWYPVSTD